MRLGPGVGLGIASCGHVSSLHDTGALRACPFPLHSVLDLAGPRVRVGRSASPNGMAALSRLICAQRGFVVRILGSGGAVPGAADSRIRIFVFWGWPTHR
jgi:hypothetical protein